MYAELGESGTDVAGMAMLGELAAKHDDARAMVLLGKPALGRGLPLDYYAYPIVGLPRLQADRAADRRRRSPIRSRARKATSTRRSSPSRTRWA